MWRQSRFDYFGTVSFGSDRTHLFCVKMLFNILHFLLEIVRKQNRLSNLVKATPRYRFSLWLCHYQESHQ